MPVSSGSGGRELQRVLGLDARAVPHGVPGQRAGVRHLHRAVRRRGSHVHRGDRYFALRQHRGARRADVSRVCAGTAGDSIHARNDGTTPSGLIIKPDQRSQQIALKTGF